MNTDLAELPPAPPMDKATKALEDAARAKAETDKFRDKQRQIADVFVTAIMQAIIDKNGD